MNLGHTLRNWQDMNDGDRDSFVDQLSPKSAKDWLEAADCQRIVSELKSGILCPYEAGGGKPEYQTTDEAREFAVEYWEGERDYLLKQIKVS